MVDAIPSVAIRILQTVAITTIEHHPLRHPSPPATTLLLPPVTIPASLLLHQDLTEAEVAVMGFPIPATLLPSLLRTTSQHLLLTSVPRIRVTAILLPHSPCPPTPAAALMMTTTDGGVSPAWPVGVLLEVLVHTALLSIEAMLQTTEVKEEEVQLGQTHIRISAS